MSWWSRRPRLVGSPGADDVLLAVGLCGVAQLEIVASGLAAVSVLPAAVCTLPLAVRRRAPLSAPLAVCAAVALDGLLGAAWEVPYGLWLAASVAAYSVAAYDGFSRAAAGGVMVLVALFLNGWWTHPDDDPTTWSQALAWYAMILAVPWVAGRLVRRNRDQARRLSALAMRLEREREASARLAVAQERTRMARELHDAIAHAVSLMVVQAAGAEAVLSSAPARALEASRAVQETGRDAISELRQMLGILRTDEHASSFRAAAPEPDVRRPRLRVGWPAWLDPLVALLLLAAAEVTVLTEQSYGAAGRLASGLLVVAATLPLALRRRFPTAVLLTIVAALAAQQLVVDWELPVPVALLIAPLLAIYSVAAHAPGRLALAAVALTVIVAVAADAVIMGRVSGLALVGWPLFAATPFICGRAVRLHRDQAEQLRTLTARLERERDARARLAVVQERTRVARELHDSIAHGVSVMVLQAGAAEQVSASARGQARQALGAVQDTGRSVLAELAQLLGVLGTDEHDSPRTPRPSLAQLDALVDHVRRAGLPVELRVQGRPIALPAGVDASAYRIIQEGLTNALKHAGCVPTEVTLSYQPDELTLEILDAGSGPHALDYEPGHGLIGMRERVALYGGELHAGGTPAGGYAVRARLPLEGDGA